MKFSLTPILALSLVSVTLQTTLAKKHNPSIRGVVTKKDPERYLKDDKKTGDSDSGDGNGAGGVSLPPGMETNGGSFELVTNEATGQTFAIFKANEEEDFGDGLRETNGCVAHEQALEFIRGYTVQAVEHDEVCLNDPNGCGGGCCRMGYQLTCDEDNMYYQLPCICNQNTQDPSNFATATYPGGVSTPGVPNIPQPGAPGATTNVIPGPATPSPVPAVPGASIPADTVVLSAESAPAPAPAPGEGCITHDYALEIIDVLGGFALSEPGCLESPLPESCPGCCRVGGALVCDPDAAGGGPGPCVCA